MRRTRKLNALAARARSSSGKTRTSFGSAGPNPLRARFRSSFPNGPATVRRFHRSNSDVIRDALRRQLAIELFDQLRRRVAPFAEAQGLLTDEDVFQVVS